MIFRDPEVSHARLPHSSGVMDFTEWVISTVLSDTDRLALASQCTLVSIGSMCSGVATEDIAMHAIQTGFTLLRRVEILVQNLI